MSPAPKKTDETSETEERIGLHNLKPAAGRQGDDCRRPAQARFQKPDPVARIAASGVESQPFSAKHHARRENSVLGQQPWKQVRCAFAGPISVDVIRHVNDSVLVDHPTKSKRKARRRIML